MKYIFNFLLIVLILFTANLVYFSNWLIDYLKTWKVSSTYETYFSIYKKIWKELKWKKYFSKSNNYLIVKYIYFLKWQKIDWLIVMNNWKEYKFKNKDINLFKKIENEIKYIKIEKINWKKIYWILKLTPNDLFKNKELEILNN